MVNEHSVESFTSRFDDNWMHLYRFSKSLNLGFSYILKKIAKFPDSFSFEIENISPPFFESVWDQIECGWCG